MNAKLYELIEQYEKTKSKTLETKIKTAFSPFSSGSAALVQINSVIGDFKYNAKKILEYINLAENIEVELVIFPEYALCGYPISDLAKKHPQIVSENEKYLKVIAKKVKNTSVIIGYLKKEGTEVFSALALLQNGEIKDIIKKPLPSTFCDFNVCECCENKETKKIFEISGKKYLVSLSHEIKATEQVHAIIDCAITPTRSKKEIELKKLFSSKLNTPLIFVNQVGAVDNISFEGTSRIYNAKGELLARLKAFEEQFLIVNLEKNLGEIYPLYTEQKAKNTFLLDYEDDLERTYKTIIQGIKNYFDKNGLKRAVLGLSGGLDSTVSAVLLADALGKENVLGISMPSAITSQESKFDGEVLAKNLGINYFELPIKNIVQTVSADFSSLFSEIEKNWNFRYTQSYTMDNIQARTRATILWGISNEFGSCIPIATSDKSELYMGYATINGDMSGGFAPIADVTKTKLFALAKWLNENREQKNAIPESIINKRPSAELAINPETNKALLAEEALMPYEFLDEIIWRFENKKENFEDMIDSEFVYEREHEVSREQKTVWLERFYSRMTKAAYKLSIFPPTVLVDSYSINKNEYRQPICSGRVNYKQLSEEEITKTFN